MEPVTVVSVGIIVCLVGYAASLGEHNDLCPRKHRDHGQCRLKPHHFPEPHRNARGKSWR